MSSLTSSLSSQPLWVVVAAIIAAILIFLVITAVIAGIVSFGYAFYIAPRLLFARQPLSAPYANQPPPPRLFTAFRREVWTAFLFYATFMAWPVKGGRNRAPGQRKTPIIFVHGYAVSRTSWSSFMRLLEQRGVDRPMYALAFNWLAPVERSSQSLARLIDRALAEQQVTQVDIVAHSWGGFLSRWYIEKLGHAARVRRCHPLLRPFGAPP